MDRGVSTAILYSSSSGDDVDWLRNGINSTLVGVDWCVSILS